MTVVTRFPPSPTGYVHIGNLRALLYNYLYAKQKGGKIIWRVEDTDRTRLVEGSVDNLWKVLEAMGLIPDEGPNKEGDFGPYYQSQRTETYKKYAQILLENKKAYYCFCDKERLDTLRAEQTALKLPTKYDKKCRFLTEDEIKEKLNNNSPYTIRLKVPENKNIIFHDTIKGKIEINSKDVDEQVLMKTDGYPTYHLANVVDDHLMEITDVIRGNEWTPSTPKHILLYNAFGWDAPNFTHLPLLLDKNKKKLSKRSGDVSVESYLEQGYLVEAILNYIALLGWNPKTTEEFFTLDELIEKFELKNVNRSGAVFDLERMGFFSGKYIAKMNTAELYHKLEKYLAEYDGEFLEKIQSFDKEYNIKILDELKGRMIKLSDFKTLSPFLYADPQQPELSSMLNVKMKLETESDIKKSLNITLDILKNREENFSTLDEMKKVFIEKIKEAEMKNGQVLWPTRFALSGEQFSPGAFEMIFILGNIESIKRIKKIINM